MGSRLRPPRATSPATRRSESGASERRPQVDEELEARQPGKLRQTYLIRDTCGDGHQEMGRIELVTQVYGDRANGRPVAEFESHGMRKIAQFVGAIGQAHPGVVRIERWKGRRRAQSDLPNARENVSGIVKNRAPQAISDQRQVHRETQVLVEHEHWLSPTRNPRFWRAGCC